MGLSALKQKARSITNHRSLKADRLYMLYIFLLGITVIFLPLAYCVMLEYRRYLRHCLKEYDDMPSAERLKKKEYPFIHPQSIEYSFSGKAYMRAIRAFTRIFAPGVGNFHMPHLNDEQNFVVKGRFAELKTHFVHISAFITLEVLFLVLIFVGGHYIISLAMALAFVLLPICTHKLVAEYLQAYVIFEKECLEIKPEDNTYNETSID